MRSNRSPKGATTKANTKYPSGKREAKGPTMPIDDDFPNEPEPATAAPRAQLKKRKSGIPTGNAGEYFVMGELLRRGFDAQLADRNTKGYDLLVGRADEQTLRKVQIKSVRAAPWFVSVSHFKDDLLNQVTVYVLLGPEDSKKAVRFFIARNAELKNSFHYPRSGKSKNALQPSCR